MAPPHSITSPALPAPPPGVDLDAEFVNVTPEQFTSVPRSSHRDGPRRLESLLALGVLTLYLSNRTGWKIPNAETLAKHWAEGADRIRRALDDVERAGFLVRFRVQGERGRWVTRTFVSADPASLEPIRQYAAELAAAYAAARAAKAAAASNQLTFPQVAPDGGFRDSVDRDPVNRGPVDRGPVTGHLKTQETVVGEQEENPPLPPPHTTAAADVAQPVTGGNDSRAILDTAAAAATAARAGAKGWKLDQVRAAMLAALNAGHRPELVAEHITRLAADTAGTQYPGRLRAALDVTAAETARKATAAPAGSGEAPPWAEGPFKYLAPDQARCHTHPGQPADGCGPCRIDAATAADMDRYLADAPALPSADAQAQARAAAARARRKPGKPSRVPRQTEPADQPPPADPGQQPELVSAAT